MKTLILGLLAVTSVGSFAFPAFSDEVNLQSVQQITTQDGEMNRSYQSSDQSIRSSQNVRRYNTPTNSQGNVQDLYQDSYQMGQDNMTRQTNVQKINTRNNVRPSRY